MIDAIAGGDVPVHGDTFPSFPSTTSKGAECTAFDFPDANFLYSQAENLETDAGLISWPLTTTSACYHMFMRLGQAGNTRIATSVPEQGLSALKTVANDLKMLQRLEDLVQTQATKAGMRPKEPGNRHIVSLLNIYSSVDGPYLVHEKMDVSLRQIQRGVEIRSHEIAATCRGVRLT